MGLFGFGKKKRQSEEAAEAAAEENDKADEAISETAEAPAGGIQETILPEPSDEYDGRGDEHGPWDVDDENVPDYDEYLDMGAYYLPFLQGIELRVKANRATQQVLGTTITYGSSSVEIEAFAAPKTMGLWDDVRADLVEANKDAKETDGVFGTELTLPVVVKGGRKVVTRIVGVDGPRWMLAPRDLIPMHPPVAPAERKAAKEAAEAEQAGRTMDIPGQPKGPFDSDQQVEVKTTLSRGPMFSEVR